MMLRLQSSWLLESVAEISSVDSVFFPFIHRFSVLNWLSRREISLHVNSPIDSQAMLVRSWLDGSVGKFSEKNIHKFNQVIQRPFDIELNPFKSWKDRIFTTQQLDYLFYWREAAYEIEDEKQREIFWATVYQIISYWLSMKNAGLEANLQPAEIMKLTLDSHGRFIVGRDGSLHITCLPLDEVAPGHSSLAVFPLLFEDDDGSENDAQSIFHAWFHGHADQEQARRDIKHALRKYLISFDRPRDFSLHAKLAALADVTVFAWSGLSLPPRLYEQELVRPLREAFSGLYKKSGLSLKAVDKSNDAYDYLLIFFN